jgi:hypothetical protein
MAKLKFYDGTYMACDRTDGACDGKKLSWVFGLLCKWKTLAGGLAQVEKTCAKRGKSGLRPTQFYFLFFTEHYVHHRNKGHMPNIKNSDFECSSGIRKIWHVFCVNILNKSKLL